MNISAFNFQTRDQKEVKKEERSRILCLVPCALCLESCAFLFLKQIVQVIEFFFQSEDAYRKVR
jgi:hypothetical protein